MMWLKVTMFHYVLNTIVLLKSQAYEEVSESELVLIVFDAIVMIELKIDSHVVEKSILSCVTF